MAHNPHEWRLTRSAHGHRQSGSGLSVLIIGRFRRCCCLFRDHPWKDNAHFNLCVCVSLISSWMKPFSEWLHSACQNRCHRRSSISGLGWFRCFPLRLLFFFNTVITFQIRCLSPCQRCWKGLRCVAVWESVNACVQRIIGGRFRDFECVCVCVSVAGTKKKKKEADRKGALGANYHPLWHGI